MTRKEKFAHVYLMVTMLVFTGMVIETFFPGQGILAGLAAPAIPGAIHIYQVIVRARKAKR